MQSENLSTITYTAGRWEQHATDVIYEKSVSLVVNNEPWLALMCTPTNLEALAIGFLYNEDILQSMEEVASVHTCASEDTVEVWLHHSVNKPTDWTRTSGCSGGQTGMKVDHPQRNNPQIKSDAFLTPEKIESLLGQFIAAQDLYKRCGGVHTSALSDGDEILITAEDIGRHNTLDKIAGLCLMSKIAPPRRILLTTGRVSSEMIQKTARLKASVIISRTSPTTLSIHNAHELGITLIGYARRDQFTVYSHPERVLSLATPDHGIREAK